MSDRVLEDSWNVAADASAIGTLQCVDAWLEDFRQDMDHHVKRNTDVEATMVAKVVVMARAR